MLWLRSPRVLGPALAGAGLLAVLLAYAGVGPVLRRVAQFQPSSLLLLGVQMLGYEAARTIQWALLLRGLDPPPPWRTAAMSYLGGELVKGLPGGQYAQPLLLRRAQGTPLAASIAAMWLLLWLEAAVCLLALGLLGSLPWPWLRPLAWGLLAGIGAAGWAVRQRDGHRRTVPPALPRRRRTALGQWSAQVCTIAGTLVRPRHLGPAAVGTATYVTLAGLVLWAIARALAANLLIVVPFDVGLIETAGTAALMACGIPRAAAVAVMLLHRVVCGVLTAGLTLAGLVVLRRQACAAWRGHAHGEPDAEPP